MTKEEYNKEPVHYCTRCLSLAQKSFSDYYYCDNCGCTNSESSSIEEWENKYVNMYGHKFIEDNGRSEDKGMF